MKNLAITFALFIGLATSVFATDGEKDKDQIIETISYAEEGFRADLMVFKTAKFALHFKDGVDQKLYVRLTDEDGNVLHYDRIRKIENLSKTYQLDNFPAGTYKIEVNNGSTILQKEIEVVKK